MAGISTRAEWASWTPEVLYIMVRVASHHAAENLIKHAQDNLASGGHNDTGTLKNSFHIEESRYGLLGVQFDVVNTAPYASFVDQGVDHDIYPHGNVLRFRPGKRRPRAGGRFVSPAGYIFATKVRGQEATNFFTDAVNGLGLHDFF